MSLTDDLRNHIPVGVFTKDSMLYAERAQSKAGLQTTIKVDAEETMDLKSAVNKLIEE